MRRERRPSSWLRGLLLFMLGGLVGAMPAASAATVIGSGVLGTGLVGKLGTGGLTTGGSDYPIKELRIAGVDLEKPEVVSNALKEFGNSVDELEKLLGQLK